MLNRFTKLTAGCVVVLFVLVALWMTERHAPSQIVIAPARADAARDLLLQGVSMQRDFYQALLDASYMNSTRDEVYANGVQTIMASFKKDYGEMGRQITHPEPKQQFEEVMKWFDQFAVANKEWWQTEVERQKAATEQLQSMAKARDSIDELTHFIAEVISEHFSITQNGETYFRADRVALKDEVSNLAIYIRDIRRMNLVYSFESDERTKKAIKEGFAKDYKYIASMIEEMALHFGTEKGRAMLRELNQNLTVWWAALNKEMELVDRLAKIDAETTNIAGEAMDKMSKMLAAFGSQW